jgi:transposase-like protein
MSESRKYRKFTAQQKLEIVLAGLRGDRSIKDVCREHEIAETLYYTWRESCWRAAPSVWRAWRSARAREQLLEFADGVLAGAVKLDEVRVLRRAELGCLPRRRPLALATFMPSFTRILMRSDRTRRPSRGR